jgi:transcriptional regulator with XRE-family HTH domain
MAASSQTVSAKAQGNHLRAVRRRKGLSLSEVARGAGLSRRELANYERGKVPIPESDLWVLAGSCGVDVSELVPDESFHELDAGPATIEDSIAQLRRALEGDQAATGAPREEREEAERTTRPRRFLGVRRARALPAASAPELPSDEALVASPPPWTPAPESDPDVPEGPVDVFEELAQLAEPVPLNSDPDEVPSFLTAAEPPVAPVFVPPVPLPLAPPPPGTFEELDDTPVEQLDRPELVESVAVASAPEDAAWWSAADAPPIDVALRGESLHPAPVFPAAEDLWPTAAPWEPTTWAEPGETWADPSLPPTTTTPWARQLDPEATSTGFLVDWGTDDQAVTADPEPVPVASYDETEPPWYVHEPTPQGDDVAPIEWHAAIDVLEPAPEPAPTAAFVAACAEPEPPAAEEQWVLAGDDWELGNALPLVEVRGQGALVMRRADERWALADLTAPVRYALEVDLELRSGPGFGVLFRSAVDEDGRMSGYSFDLDPLYEGGGYLVRQWQGDRELWNPIAKVAAPDPSTMYGRLTVRLVIDGDRLVASVNGTQVMRVEDLGDASRERGRDAPEGVRVGVQAWSSSDLVIDTLRLAPR